MRKTLAVAGVLFGMALVGSINPAATSNTSAMAGERVGTDVTVVSTTSSTPAKTPEMPQEAPIESPKVVVPPVRVESTQRTKAPTPTTIPTTNAQSAPGVNPEPSNEDEQGWDCRNHGNRVCGVPDEAGNVLLVCHDLNGMPVRIVSDARNCK